MRFSILQSEVPYWDFPTYSDLSENTLHVRRMTFIQVLLEPLYNYVQYAMGLVAKVRPRCDSLAYGAQYPGHSKS